MRVLAIDPGYDRLGAAILEHDAGKNTLLFSECFLTDKKSSFFARLGAVGGRVAKLIESYGPEALAIEKLYFENNQKTAMHVAEARGAILYEAMRHGLAIAEFTPLQVKAAVTGNGRSSKDGVIKMVGLLIRVPKRAMKDDEYDAIALGLTFFASANGRAARST